MCVFIKWFKLAEKNIKNVKLKFFDEGKYFWVNRKDLEVESGVANWAPIFDKCDLEKQKYRQELTPNVKYQPCRVFVRNDLVKKKLKAVEIHQKEFRIQKKVRIRP